MLLSAKAGARGSQSVVHGFTTVMHEVGGNVGFIISKKGMQPGAEKYTRNTNIHGLTYEEFQKKYFPIWHSRCFVPVIGGRVDSLVQYVEPLNSRRDKVVESLPENKRNQFLDLVKEYKDFGLRLGFFQNAKYLPGSIKTPNSIEEVKTIMEQWLKGKKKFYALYFRDLGVELVAEVEKITELLV